MKEIAVFSPGNDFDRTIHKYPFSNPSEYAQFFADLFLGTNQPKIKDEREPFFLSPLLVSN